MVEAVDTPALAGTLVLVKVAATAINRADTLQVMRALIPLIFCYNVVFAAQGGCSAAPGRQSCLGIGGFGHGSCSRA